MKMTKMRIEGKPQPKQRPRVTKNGTYTPKETLAYEKLVQWEYIAQKGKKLTGALKMAIAFNLKIPKSRKDLKVGDWHTQRPDLDNLVKSYKDALNEFAYDDDAQVVEIIASKKWANEDYVELEIKEVRDEWLYQAIPTDTKQSGGL
jgi:Holliday junction resolvase RusA-like endonuclease